MPSLYPPSPTRVRRERRRSVRDAVHLLAVLALLALSACRSGTQSDAAAQSPAIPVEVAAVDTGLIEAAYRGTATLEAQAEAAVVAKQSGVIEQVLAEEGQKVRTGQVLARLESERLRLELARTQSTLDKLRQDFTRAESVYARKLISREDYERIQFELAGARAAQELAALALRETEIPSPLDGVVTLRSVKAGNMVQAGSAVFRVTRLEPLEAQVHVPERDIHKLAPAQTAALTVDAWPGRTFRAAIERINPVVDAQTGTVKVTLRMAPDQPELKPGMFGRVEILYERRENAVRVPRDALMIEDANPAVYVIEAGQARHREVRLGHSEGERAEVLEGLRAGEQVVVTGQSSLKDGARVSVVNAPAGEAPRQAGP